MSALKRNIKSVLESSPDLVFDRSYLFFRPIGYYLRGCAFQIGRAQSFAYVSRFVAPLFEEGAWYGGWGIRLRTLQGGEGWDFDSPHFTEYFPELFEKSIRPAVANVTTGAAFLRYLETEKMSSHWLDYGHGLAYLHMGNLAAAKQKLDAFLDCWDRLTMSLENKNPEPDMVVVRQVRQMIESDYTKLDAYLREVAAAQVKEAKLEKYWVPPKSFFDGPIDTSGI
jgi:hypothetical protein